MFLSNILLIHSKWGYDSYELKNSPKVKKNTIYRFLKAKTVVALDQNIYESVMLCDNPNIYYQTSK